MLAQAVTATKRLDHKVLAELLREQRDEDDRRPHPFGPTASGANPRTLMAQFRGVADKNLDQFREPGKQVIVVPGRFKTGELISRSSKARKS